MELDLHALGVRVMYLYTKYDGNFRHTKLLAVESGAKIPKSDMVGSYVPELLSTTLKTTLYKLEKVAPFELSFDSFFGPRVNPDGIKIRENYFWTVLLQYSCTTVTIAMKKIVDLIGTGNFFAWIPNPDGVLKKNYMADSAVGILKIFFVPKELNVTVTAYPEFNGHLKDRVQTTESYFPGQSSTVHECILLQNKFVVDPSAMQFGHRGAKKELVGHTLCLENYVTGFKGDVLRTEPRTKQELFGQYKWTDTIIDSIVEHVMGDLRDGKKWCSYCGKDVVELQTCGRCKSVCYCGKYCQRSDWSGHKPTCKVKEELEPSQVVEDKAPGIEAI